MCKRKNSGRELRVPSRPTSPVFSSSSSGEWPQISRSSSSSFSSYSSSVSYSSKLPTGEEEKVHGADGPETKAMDLVGCPRCFMYVMLSEEDPKCPKCKNTVFLEFFKDESLKTDN